MAIKTNKEKIVFEDFSRTYSFPENRYPRESYLFLFSRITRDAERLIDVAIEPTIKITGKILATLNKALEREVKIAGLKETELSDLLSLGKDADLDLVSSKIRVGHIKYTSPKWNYAMYASDRLFGGVSFAVDGNQIANISQHLALERLSKDICF